MPLITIYGINAVGKDTIAKELKSENPEIFVTSESRLLMYHLGIIDEFGIDSSVTKSDYKKLESTTQDRILSITNGTFKADLVKFRNSRRITILLSHLVFMLHIDKADPIFLTDKDPAFPELADALIHIKSDPEDIFSRRIKDNIDGIRERYHTDLKLIKKHQSLCDEKWGKIIKNRTKDSYTIIFNGDIKKAISEVNNFIKQI